MAVSQLVREADGVCRVTGTLSLDSVPELKDQGIDLLSGGPDHWSFDLADAEFVGSAGVALLVAWLRAAGEAGKELIFLNPSARLIRIAEVCGTTEMLGLEPSEAVAG